MFDDTNKKNETKKKHTERIYSDVSFVMSFARSTMCAADLVGGRCH